ncbi:major capsid protein [Chicken microvirus mg7_14]|nr:major capsid protein [Chicken microvirus mg7_14]
MSKVRPRSKYRKDVNRFASIPSINIKRSVLPRSFEYKTTFDAGYLIPFYCKEVLPADTVKLSLSSLLRLTTPKVPFMDGLYVSFQFFFVPNRLVWDHWVNMMGERKNPEDSIDFLTPTIDITNAQNGTLTDYFGLPTNVTGTYKVSALPFRAYNLIFNEWYRDQNLQDSLPVPTGDGPDKMSDYKLMRRAKYHDYFTSALPAPQKGPASSISLTGEAPVMSNGPLKFDVGSRSSTYVPGQVFSDQKSGTVSSGSLHVATSSGPASDSIYPVSLGSDTSLYADLTNVGDFTINDLRQAWQIQKLLETDMRSGTRYTEVLRAHFSVLSPDARLQRPEYLGGFTRPIAVSPVVQTSSTDTTSPQGNLAALSATFASGRGFTKSFVEHGWIIGLMSVRSDISYQQGVHRQWTRQGRYDYYWPVFAHLGEQPVLNKEIFVQGTAEDDEPFGYQERYAEYRYDQNMITGKLRSTDPQSLDMWHLSQEFENLPTLSEQFIQENPPLKRVLAVTSEPQFIGVISVNSQWTRAMPVYGVPGLVDHF